MDMGKVFNENDSIPQHLLDQVKKAKLKGELCDECSLLNDKFTGVYRKFVKIELELFSSLKLIQNKLLTSKETDKTNELRSLAKSVVGSSGWMGKLDILDNLRSEAIQKCSKKLSPDTPRVKLQNWTTAQVMKERARFKNKWADATRLDNFSPDPSFQEMSRPETESPHVDSIHDSDDDDAQSINYSDTPETLSQAPNNFNRQRNLKTNSMNNDDTYAYSFVVVTPPTSSNIAKPQPILNPETKKYKCNICPTEHNCMAHFKAHYESVHQKVKYKCTICGNQYVQRRQYYLHHRSVHIGVRVKCLGCNKMFTRKSTLLLHQRKHGCYKTVSKTEIE